MVRTCALHFPGRQSRGSRLVAAATDTPDPAGLPEPPLLPQHPLGPHTQIRFGRRVGGQPSARIDRPDELDVTIRSGTFRLLRPDRIGRLVTAPGRLPMYPSGPMFPRSSGGNGSPLFGADPSVDCADPSDMSGRGPSSRMSGFPQSPVLSSTTWPG